MPLVSAPLPTTSTQNLCAEGGKSKAWPHCFDIVRGVTPLFEKLSVQSEDTTRILTFDRSASFVVARRRWCADISRPRPSSEIFRMRMTSVRHPYIIGKHAPRRLYDQGSTDQVSDARLTL